MIIKNLIYSWAELRYTHGDGNSIELAPVVNAAGLKTIYSQLNYLVCGIVDKR